MQDNDLNIEDFKEIFIKSFFGETVSTQEISDYFEVESEKFKNRFLNENHTQRIKDIIFKKFIKGIEEANTNLSNPFIEREYKRSFEISDLKVQGVDINDIEKPSRYNMKIPLPYLCKKFGFGVHLELEQIEYIYQGFELFKQQHEENSNKPAPPATVQPTNTTLTQKIKGDSYKELLNDSLVIELIDCEVNWIDYYEEINAFCSITKEEHDEWKDKKILIKDFLNKHDTFQKYYNHLQDLTFDIINEIDCQELNITDNTLQNLKKRSERLNSITNSLFNLFWDDWGRDHENFGGEWMSHAKKGIKPKGKYQTKFSVSKLWYILNQYCKVKDVGYDCEIENQFGTHFITNEGEKVYITGGFLSLLAQIFQSRQSTFNTIIQHLEPNIITLPAKEQPTDPKPIKDKPVISFKTMFVKSSEYDNVLGYISEYLTDTKQWKESIIYLSAFYGVLRDRGYLNKIYKAPQINSTLKNEFGIEPTTTDKNFQDAEINNAVGLYAEAFNMIPSLKFTK